ncbi:hypothetical protein BASA84_000859 [Batrachochytrium salamandrivorans]|nr:hypothetical protein BASA84_000859 [Batrachochytrium salamandrivorans]
MQGHYGSLAADTTGHSLDLQYWHDRQPIQVSLIHHQSETVNILDQDFSWNQIAAALLQMSPRKAPATMVFASATIPRAWLCASIVSIDKKDGDPLNPGDKRGIALINVGLKLVCKVLQMRIERFVETNNLLIYEQAGFRKREEHCTHPHLLERAGSLLSDPFRTEGQTGMSIVWTTIQSVHQRHSRWCRTHHSPWTTRDTNPIRGLMYADDVAVFADSEQSLLAASTAIEQWANQWECSLTSAWLKQKRSALEHTISALHPVLANHQLTVNYRLAYSLQWSWAKPTMGSSWAVGKIPALVLVSSDQTAIQEQILADTTSQTKDSQATASFALMETLEHVETLHRSKSMSLDNSWTLLVLQGSQFRPIASTWHKII